MVKEDLKLSDILTRKAFENAIKVNAAIGGSTNFVIHLMAIAGGIGIDLADRRFRQIVCNNSIACQPAAIRKVILWKIFITPVAYRL